MSDHPFRLTDDLITQGLRARSVDPDRSLLDDIVRTVAATPQDRRWFGLVPMGLSRRALLIVAIALLLATMGAIVVGSGILPPNPVPAEQLTVAGQILEAANARDPESLRSLMAEDGVLAFPSVDGRAGRQGEVYMSEFSMAVEDFPEAWVGNLDDWGMVAHLGSCQAADESTITCAVATRWHTLQIEIGEAWTFEFDGAGVRRLEMLRVDPDPTNRLLPLGLVDLSTWEAWLRETHPLQAARLLPSGPDIFGWMYFRFGLDASPDEIGASIDHYLAAPTLEEWTPERTRAEGSHVDFLASRSPSPSGLDAELYCIGQAITSGSPCDRFHPYDPEEDQHWVVEVTQGGRSALFEVLGTPLVKDFDEDSLLIEDGPDRAPRFRLLQADGTAVQLRQISDLAPAIPGPDLLLIQDLDVYRRGMIGADGPQEPPYLVDDRAGTLQRLDVPAEIKWWGPNVDEFLWGGNGCRAIWQQPDGSFDHHDVDCQYSAGHTDPGWNWGDGFAEWLEPGRMALVEWSEDGGPLVVHASLDRGATWHRIEVGQRNWNTTGVIADALADAMRQLD